MATREEWIEERRKAITASDMASILGLNPMRPPISIFIEKLHPEMAETDDSELLEFGAAVEPVIAGAYQRSTGTPLYDPGRYELVHHPKYPEIAATIDRITTDRRKIVECKWQTQWADKFGDPGSSEVPDAYAVQCATQMAVWGCEVADIATMRSGPPLLVYPLYRDIELENMVIDRAREWFDHHIIQGKEPEVDSSEDWKRYLAKKFPRSSGKLAEGDEAINATALEFIAAKKRIQELETLADGYANQVRAFIGEADGLLLPNGSKILWSVVKESEIKAYTRKAYRKIDIREKKNK